MVLKRLFTAVALICSLAKPLSANDYTPPQKAAVDPATAIAVAQFSFSVYQMVSGGGKNPMDAIAKMLQAINQKLNIINNKLDLVIQELDEIPNKVQYKIAYSRLHGVYSRLDEIYRNYEKDIERYGERRGRKKFLKAYGSTIQGWLDDVKVDGQSLLTYHDPLTVSFICAISRMHYELGTLIGRDPAYLQTELKVYYNYLQEAAWYAPTSLEKNIASYKKAQKDLFDIDYKFEVRVLHINFYHRSFKTYTEEKITDSVEKIAVRHALLNGLYSPVKGSFTYRRDDINRDQYRALGGSFVQVRNFNDFRRRVAAAPGDINPKIKSYHFQILQLSTAYLGAMETIKFLKSIVHEN
jgi:hypothetical protein